MISELFLFHSKESQKTAIRKWTKQLRGSWSWALYVGFGATLCVLLGAKIVWELQVMMPIWAAIMIGGGSCIISLGILVHFFARRSLVPHLRRELNASGIPVCMTCGYDLRGSKERCPECGQKFHALEQPPTPMAIKLDPKLLDDYVGKYRVAGTGTVFEFRKENDALFVFQAGAPKMPIFPESETKFFYKALDAQFSFVREGKGKAKRIILYQYNCQRPGNRIE